MPPYKLKPTSFSFEIWPTVHATAKYSNANVQTQILCKIQVYFRYSCHWIE